MRSGTPKVLHRLAGRSIIELIVGVCQDAGVGRLQVVVNPAQKAVAEALDGRCEVVYQTEQRGTGHALAQASPDLLSRGDVLVINGDQPLFRLKTIRALIEAHRSSRAAATLATVDDPMRDDGRVVRNPDGSFDRIVEAKDADEAARRLTEINVGLYCFRGLELMQALVMLQPDNKAGELYLTDVFRHIRPVHLLKLNDAEEAMGINDRIELARADRVMRLRILHDLMRAGVTVVDPDTTFIDKGVEVGQDTVIEPMSFLRGKTRVGSGCRIGPGSHIVDSEIEDGCQVEYSYLSGCRLRAGSDCGPFARLRSGADVGPDVHMGSFGEVVRSRVGARSRIPHFSYVGDAEVGEAVNIGAGSVTSNYDGEKDLKSKTVIGDGALIGVDTIMTAPVRVGRRSVTGNGSVVTKDVPDESVVVGMPARVIRRRGERRDR
jgi:bifunctional UDP-N-acetylglucosamine pyrophosphorylase/glucosamine-1-phosphate N-acetyltransferase